MRTLLRISLLAIVALTLLATAVAQDTPGLTTSWTIALSAPTPHGGEGIAQYITYTEPTPSKMHTKFIVQCEYVNQPNLTALDVFVGPGKTPSQPYGKLVGRMHIVNGAGSLLLTSARAPLVTKGTTVTIMYHQGDVIMAGQF